MANVLITGCSSGFGLLGALKFARGGDTVFATMRTPSKGAELEKARDAERLDLRVLPLDVTDQASIDKAVAEIEAKGGVDVLVNNAGYELSSPIELAQDDEVRGEFDTNVLGILRTVRAVAPHMRARGRGSVINVSSVAGIVAPPFGGWYAASKHAVEAISEALYYELKPFGIRVAVIEPGAYETGFGGNITPARNFTVDSPYRAAYDNFQQAMGRLREGPATGNDPQQVADAIYDAAYTEAPKLRYICGADANMIATVRRATDFEGFENAMRQTLDWHD